MSAMGLTGRQGSSYSYYGFGGTETGASKYADSIPSLYRNLVARFADSATGSKRIADPTQTILETFLRCMEPNWDRQGAIAMPAEAAREARILLIALPSFLPLPDIYPEATGSMVFEWYRRPGRRLVITLSGRGTVEYAGLIGTGNEVYGELRFGNTLPKILQDHLRDLFSD